MTIALHPGRPVTAPQRQPTTMWNLLVWAYRRQMVQYETDRHMEHRAGYLLDDIMASQSGYAERGCINGAGTTAHDDAHVVHAHVMGLRPRAQDLLIHSASRAAPPNWNPPIPPLKITPLWKGPPGRVERVNGVLTVLGSVYRLWRKGNPVGHLIAYEGVPEDEAERIRQRARDAYTDWWQALRQVRLTMVHEHRLSLWRVSEMGAVDEPWNAGA
jgi:hypothetical protein